MKDFEPTELHFAETVPDLLEAAGVVKRKPVRSRKEMALVAVAFVISVVIVFAVLMWVS